VLPDFDPERIVEVPCDIRAGSVTPDPQPCFPGTTVGSLRMLADDQAASADAIWADDPDAMALALAANPLVLSFSLARALLRAREWASGNT